MKTFMRMTTRVMTWTLGLIAPVALIIGLVTNDVEVDRKVEAMRAATTQVASR